MDVAKWTWFVLVLCTVSACGGGGGGGGQDSDRGNTAPKITISGRAALEANKAFGGGLVSIDLVDVTQTSTQELAQGKYIQVITSSQVPAVDANGQIQFELDPDTLQDDTLYRISVTCPTPSTLACTLKLPLNAVMSGSRLKQGGWSISILSEIAYQNLAYYVAAAFSNASLQQELQFTARSLLGKDVDGSGAIDYEDVLRWHPQSSDSATYLNRPKIVTELIVQLQSNGNPSAHQLKVQTAASIGVTSLTSPRFATGVAINDGLAFIADMDGTCTWVVDVRDPANPRYLTPIDSAGAVGNVTVKDNYVYSVGERFQISYINDQDVISVVADIEVPDRLSSIEVHNGYAYVGNTERGLQIFDVSEPTTPHLVGELGNPGEASSAKVYNGFLYVSKRHIGFEIYRLKNPEAPEWVKTINYTGEILGLTVVDGLAYVAAEKAGLKIFDVRNPDSAFELVTIDTPGQALGVAVHGNHAYVADGTSGMQVIDVSNPAAPKLVSKADTLGMAFNVWLQDGLAYVSSGHGGVSVFDVNSIATPLLVGNVDMTGRSTNPTANNAAAFLVNRLDNRVSNLHVINVQDSAAPVGLGRVNIGDADLFGMVHYEGHVYAVGNLRNQNTSFLWVVDATNPLGIDAVKRVQIGSANLASDVYLENGFAYIVGGSTMTIVDVKNPASPLKANEITLPFEAGRLVMQDGYAYMTDRADKFHIVDAHKRGNRLIVSSLGLTGTPLAIAVHNGYAYLAVGTNGIHVIDVRRLDEPTLLSTVDTPGVASHVATNNDFAYVSDGISGVQVINIGNPILPVLLGRARTWGMANMLTINNGMLYIATDSGLEILREIPLLTQ